MDRNRIGPFCSVIIGKVLGKFENRLTRTRRIVQKMSRTTRNELQDQYMDWLKNVEQIERKDDNSPISIVFALFTHILRIHN